MRKLTAVDGPTHKHKRAGEVVVLRSTAELMEVKVSCTGEKFWAKRSDVTEISVRLAGANSPRKKRTSE